MSKIIFWLDDQPHFLEDYQEELRRDRRLELIFVDDADTALARLSEPGFHLDLLIWDMMLPPGSLGPHETDGGLNAGAVFYRRFRALFADTPAILLSNVSDPHALAPYDTLGEKHSWAYQKRDLLPDELAAEVEKILDLSPHSSEPHNA